jgi:hypothetical protein
LIHWPWKGFFSLGDSGGLQDKQDKLTATTAKNRKNELRGLIVCGASIYLL